ncbi:S1 family peptidase [Streptomyces sp. NPDC051018]|uniref:S1 family peptidase n=1 Tax=Streptomyces sp. NPDC051018 TaxID=3365639 RepID=UPI003792753B
MKHRRIPKRKLAITGGSVLAVMAAGLTLQSANASDVTQRYPVKPLSVTAAGKLASSLSDELGPDLIGTYYDAAAGSLVVNVADEAAADSVRDAGGRARVVQNTLAELAGARRTLTDKAAIPGTSWAVDPVTNKVVVTADRTVTGASWNRLSEVVEGLGHKAELRKSAGEFKPFAAGGDAIHNDGGRCSLGFNVVKDGAPHFLTAGHCGAVGSRWSASPGGPDLGRMVDSRFPGDDFALVAYTAGGLQPSEVNLYDGGTQRITGAAEATVGMPVRRSGSTTRVHDGQVTGLDATVNYGNGDIVNGLVETSVCAEPGDSGGPLFSGDRAVGLTSGGSGDCASGGQTFFQPVTEALGAYGATIG